MTSAPVSSCCSSGSTYQSNNTCASRCVKIFVALGIITLIGGVLCIVFAYQYPLAAETLTYGACFALSFATISLSVAARIRNASSDFSPSINRLFNPANNNNRIYQSNAGREARISIHVNKAELTSNPRPHLTTIAREIENHVRYHERGGLSVQFEGRNERGLDAGGLTREYLDDIMRAITDLEDPFNKVEGSALAVPIARNNENFELYKQLGQLMMFCYPTLQVGFHFDPSVFRVALSLSAAEIDGTYDSLSFERKLQLYNILTYYQEEGAHENMLNLLALEEWSFEQLGTVVQKVNEGATIPLDFIQTVDPNQVCENPAHLRLIREALRNVVGDNEVRELLLQEQWNENQTQVAIQKLLANEILPEALDDLIEDVELNPQQIAHSPNDLARIRVALQKLAASFYDPQVRGIYALAKGMKSVCVKGRNSSVSEQNAKWNQDFYVSNLEQIERSTQFSTTLQGRVDKEFVAERIWYNGLNQQIRTKVEWLKEWVRDPQTEERKIRQLLKFSTGSSSLPSDKYLNVTEQYGRRYIPTPVAHTCSNQINLSPEPCGEYEYRDAEEQIVRVYNPNNIPQGVREVGVHDRTKAGFIRALEAAISGDSGFHIG